MTTLAPTRPPSGQLAHDPGVTGDAICRPLQTSPLFLMCAAARAVTRSERHRARTGMDDSKKDLTFNACADLALMSRAEPSRAEPSRAEPSRAEPSRAEPSRAEPSRAEPSRAEPSRAEPSYASAHPLRLTVRPRPPGRGIETGPGSMETGTTQARGARRGGCSADQRLARTSSGDRR